MIPKSPRTFEARTRGDTRNMLGVVCTVDFRNFIVFVWAETLAH